MDKTTKIIIWVIVAVIVVGGIWYGANKQQKEQGVIKIGAILPLSGDFANFGNDVVKGINLYIENNPNLKFVTEDDKGDSKESITAFKKLSGIDGVTYFYGPFGPASSEVLYSAQSEEERDNFTFVAMSMCSDQFKNYKNMICNYPSPYYQLQESFKLIKEKNVNAFYPILANDTNGQAIFLMLSQISEELNLQITGESKVDVKNSEFYTITSKAIKSGPKFIFIGTGQPTTNFKIVKELKEKGYSGMIIIGSDVEEKQIKEFQDTLEGVYFTGIAKVQYDPAFLALYSNKYKGEEPNLYTAYGYMWAEILHKLISANPKHHFTIEDIQKYINDNSDELVIKGIKYQNKEIELPMKILFARDGELEEVFVSGE